MQEPAQSAPEAPKPMSFVDKVVNIFASPGELYEDVRLTPKTVSNWLVPWLIFVVIAVALMQLVMSDPAMVDQMRSMMRQRIDQAVAEGTITQEMADQQIETFGPSQRPARLGSRMAADAGTGRSAGVSDQGQR